MESQTIPSHSSTSYHIQTTERERALVLTLHRVHTVNVYKTITPCFVAPQTKKVNVLERFHHYLEVNSLSAWQAHKKCIHVRAGELSVLSFPRVRRFRFDESS